MLIVINGCIFIINREIENIIFKIINKVTAEMNLRNYPIINEDDDEHIITSTGLDSIKKPSAPKSDH